MTAVLLAGQTAVLTALVLAPHECRFSVQCEVIAPLHAFYEAITIQTEFIVSLVNSVKTVNIRLYTLGMTTPP